MTYQIGVKRIYFMKIKAAVHPLQNVIDRVRHLKISLQKTFFKCNEIVSDYISYFYVY